MFKWLIDDERAAHLRSDFEYTYRIVEAEKGGFRANAWYARQVALSLFPILLRKIAWSGVMFRNYVKVAVRNLRSQKAYSSINILGLSVGMACCILILLFVHFELSFDTYHENAERIYRVTTETVHSGRPFQMAPTAIPLAPALKNDFPEVVHATRLSQRHGILFHAAEKRFYESVYFVDPDMLRIFTLPLRYGDIGTALSKPYSLVLTPQTAEKYY